MSTIEKFITWARAEGWRVALHKAKRPVPVSVMKRYPALPPELMEFLQTIEVCASADDTIFFICTPQYEDAQGFRWNELEKMSLEAARDDPLWMRDVRAFWDQHLSVIFSVSGDYHYYALRMADGKIIEGWSPEFQETSETAGSFGELLDGIFSGTIKLS